MIIIHKKISNINYKKCKISIIIHCRNEEKYISKYLDSIIANNYSKNNLEILVVDGMSENGTRNIINEYIRRYSFVSGLENFRKVTPCAMNIGIRNCK